MSISDIYYRRPVLYDYIISLACISVLFKLVHFKYINLPVKEKVFTMSSDIGAVGLTVSGFILTLLTIIVTIKNSEDAIGEQVSNKSSSFKVFFDSPLYFRSVDILRHAVISLVIISLMIYLIKMILPNDLIEYLFYLNVTGVMIIFSTFFRSLFILKSIVKLQKKPSSNK